jgi:hypothetical protein
MSDGMSFVLGSLPSKAANAMLQYKLQTLIPTCPLEQKTKFALSILYLQMFPSEEMRMRRESLDSLFIHL